MSQWHPTLWILDARGVGDTGIGSNSKKSQLKTSLVQFYTFNRGKVVVFPVDGVARTLVINGKIKAKVRYKRLIQFTLFLIAMSKY